MNITRAQLVQTGVRLAAMALMKRDPKITLETPPVDYSKLRKLASTMPVIPTTLELTSAILEELEAEVARAHVSSPVTPPLALPEPKGVPQSDGVACIPCTVSHLATCAGQLNEAIRFAREDIASPEVGRRVDICLSEITAAERVDLAPENVASLPPEEKTIANDSAKGLRDIRHSLEWYTTYGELETAAAQMSKLQHQTSEAWRQARLSRLSPEQAATLKAVAEETAAAVLAEIDEEKPVEAAGAIDIS